MHNFDLHGVRKVWILRRLLGQSRHSDLCRQADCSSLHQILATTRLFDAKFRQYGERNQAQKTGRWYRLSKGQKQSRQKASESAK